MRKLQWEWGLIEYDEWSDIAMMGHTMSGVVNIYATLCNQNDTVSLFYSIS